MGRSSQGVYYVVKDDCTELSGKFSGLGVVGFGSGSRVQGVEDLWI